MMWNKNKGRVEGKDKAAGWIAKRLLQLQNSFASFMRARTSGLSIQALKTWLLIFCIICTCLSIHAFIGAFDGHSSKQLKPDQLSVPKYYDQPEIKHVPRVTHLDIERIAHFKKFMDSLQTAPERKNIYDSIIKARPGLMDSLQQIESFYYSQLK